MIKLNTIDGEVWVNASQVVAVLSENEACVLILNGGTHNRLTIQGTVEDTIAAIGAWSQPGRPG